MTWEESAAESGQAGGWTGRGETYLDMEHDC